MQNAKVLRLSECETVEAEWGSLTWFASSKLGNSTEMTVGKCIIKPSCENPIHSHPNCSEVLVVLQGTIIHTVEEGKETELRAGDTITLPPNLQHNARNIGEADAVLFIAFSSADRQTKGE